MTIELNVYEYVCGRGLKDYSPMCHKTKDYSYMKCFIQLHSAFFVGSG
jgi:hypothetical protein